MCIAFGFPDNLFQIILSKLFSKNGITFRFPDNIVQFILSTSIQYKNDINININKIINKLINFLNYFIPFHSSNIDGFHDKQSQFILSKFCSNI